MLSGGRAATPFRPKTDAEFVDAARHVLAETRALHRLDAETWSSTARSSLPLGEVSGDKETVRFRQVVRGVPVVGGFVKRALRRGRLAALDPGHGLPDLATQETRRRSLRAERWIAPRRSSAPSPRVPDATLRNPRS
jgi:hypothetical protein